METIISKVRAEIERRYNTRENFAEDSGSSEDQEVLIELASILRFLDTLEEQPVDVSRDENIGLSIMFFLGTHVKHENSVLVRGKDAVTYKEACEWIRRQIARGSSEKPNNHLEGLDEAAERFIQDKVDAAGHPGWDWETRDVFDGFKAGAEWSLSQFEKVALSDDLYMNK